jgi:hypothetical protein
MPNNKKPTKAQSLAAVQALIAGTQQHDPNGSYKIGNVDYTSQQLITLLQTLATAMIRQLATEKAAKDALTELEAVQTGAHPILLGYTRLLRVSYGKAATTLADYGLAPIKTPTPLTAEEKAAAQAKRKATLAAEGKKSAKATTASKGTAATATEPAPPAAAPAPAKPAG